MKILMLTNTYSPHVGGVARSVAAFSGAYREMGHQVLVVAPEFANQPRNEEGVVRIAAIQNFNGSDFSAVLPVSGLLRDELDRFQPDIVHAHHPYLLGMTAVRVARYRQLPLVFTHHTLYEQYTHYVPGDSPTLQRFVIELATRFANLADQVFAPSESIAALMRKRGVHTPMAVIPTGVAVDRFASGNGGDFRQQLGIAPDAFLVGHLGRLAPEKNLSFLSECLIDFVKREDRAEVLIVGVGPLQARIRDLFEARGLGCRLHLVGNLEQGRLVDAYHAMDLFAFASRSETQGMVITEAMAAGVPVVALDANGVRDVVRDDYNGRLVASTASRADFVAALQWFRNLPGTRRQQFSEAAIATAGDFSMAVTARRALDCYRKLLDRPYDAKEAHYSQWLRIQELLKAEWEILEGLAGAAGAALNLSGVNPGGAGKPT